MFINPVYGLVEFDAIGEHGLFRLGAHIVGAWRRKTFHLSIPAFAEAVSQQGDFDTMEDSLKVLNLFELTLIGLCLLGESAPLRMEKGGELFESFRRF